MTIMDNVPLGRCLGLIGGLGVGATVHYYKELARAHDAAGLPLHLLVAHADMRRVFEYFQSGAVADLAESLNSLLVRLQAGGADLAAISAVTPHICIQELRAISPLPLVNLLDCVANEIELRGLRRVAIFGTQFTIESGLFGSLENVVVVKAEPDEVDYIHSTHFELARDGRGSDEARQRLATIARRLCEREKAEAIILAGTDFSLLFNEHNTDFPHLDCAQLHIRAIMHARQNSPVWTTRLSGRVRHLGRSLKRNAHA